MIKRYSLVIIAVVLFVLNSCTTPLKNTVAFGEEFTLTEGQEEVLIENATAIQLIKFIYSPCPPDAVCIWSGVDIVLTMTEGGWREPVRIDTIPKEQIVNIPTTTQNSNGTFYKLSAPKAPQNALVLSVQKIQPIVSSLQKIPDHYDDGSFSVIGYNTLAPRNTVMVRGTVAYKSFCPPCPEGAMCIPCPPPFIILGDPLDDLVTRSDGVPGFKTIFKPEHLLRIELDNEKTPLEVDQSITLQITPSEDGSMIRGERVEQ